MFLWKFIMKIYTATSDLLKKWQACSVNTNTERHLLLGLHCVNGSDLIINLQKMSQITKN